MTGGAGMAVRAEAVGRRFGRDGPGRVDAVLDASLGLEPGEFAAVAGRSGSGKTTLLALIGALDRPTSGRVLLDGADPAAMSRGDRTRLARSIGVVLQGAALLRRLPVWENVAAGLVPLGHSSRERRRRAAEMLDRVGLPHLAHRRPEELSAGERQRAALARALALGPRLVLADEPTSNLDPESAAVVSDVLAEVGGAGATVLVASHDPALLGRASRRFFMSAGRLLPA